MQIDLADRSWRLESTDMPIAAGGEQWTGWADFDRRVLYIWRGADQPLVTLCRLVDRLMNDPRMRNNQLPAAGLRLTEPDEQGRRYVIRFYDSPEAPDFSAD